MLVVGFDLDLTLLDTRPGICAAMSALSAETGVPIDPEVVVGRLGPKLETELAHWFPPEMVEPAAERYRELYWDTCVGTGTSLLPGARASVDAVRAQGGSVLVVTAKSEPLSHRCLDRVGITADTVVGYVHGAEKGDALRAHNAHVYVGDTVADVEAGVAADVLAVGVTTGMHDAATLGAAGAAVVFASLEPFPDWLRGLLSHERSAHLT